MMDEIKNLIATIMEIDDSVFTNIGMDCEAFLEAIGSNDTIIVEAKRTIENGINNNVPKNEIVDELVNEFQANIEELTAIMEETTSEKKKKICQTFINLIDGWETSLINFIDDKYPSFYVQRISEDAVIPSFAHAYDAGADIYAIQDDTINPGETRLIPTGLKMAIPVGYAVLIYPRSGLSLKTGLRIANSVGVVDAGYLDEIKVIITNTASEPYTIKKGDRFAQFVAYKLPAINYEEVTEVELFSSVNRVNENGDSGFGSSGN